MYTTTPMVEEIVATYQSLVARGVVWAEANDYLFYVEMFNKQMYIGPYLRASIAKDYYFIGAVDVDPHTMELVLGNRLPW